MTRKVLSLFLGSILCAGCMPGCGSNKNDAEADVKPRANIEAAPVVVGKIDNIISSTGSFQVLRDEQIKSTINGRVEKVFVLEGDRVTKGQVLVTVLSQESYAAIAGAEQLVSQATTEADRTRSLLALRIAETTASIAKITAPFSGAITRRYASEGELVSQGSDLVKIVDPATEYFLANIPLSQVWLLKVGEGARVTIPAMNTPPLRGTVEAINPATDPNSQSVQVRISLRRIPALVTAGTFGNIDIKVGEHTSAVLVPKAAVYHDDELNQNVVWRIQGDSLALITHVSVGLADSSHVEITSGLKPGDVVATVGGYGLPDSTNVTVTRHQSAARP
jgi:multidrug efflux pump subunit AcrA (membrane-fusion protein)